ncbi:MAG: MATE family efflux transporter [Erysipelotrichaceae bacterium]|nr:MATE family efflux transporter [Erysipelotrichaceae bacterium]
MVLKQNTRSLTQGSITKEMILFSLPLVLGNLFQQLYNTVDSIIVGNFVGKDALAAVGTSTPLINLLIGFFMGVATGAGIVISRYYGAKKIEEMRKSIHTFCAFTLIIGFLMTIIGVLGSRTFLRWTGVPEDILPLADTYLKIYFGGIGATMIYNSGSGILRAVGDSRRPLYFLILSSLVNVALDFVFVVFFHMGVAGVAWATVLATALSAILVFVVLMRDEASYRVVLKEIKIYRDILMTIIKVGIPTGLQQTIVSLSNTMVMAYVNGFNSAAIAGFGSARKFDNLLTLPMQSYCLAITTFVSQNLGAKKPDRAKKGVLVCYAMCCVTTIVLGLPSFIFAENCMRIFVDDAEVIRYGAAMMRVVLPFYFVMGLNQVMMGAIRGIGLTTIPMGVSIFTHCLLRQLFLAVSMPLFKDVSLVYWSYPVTWSIAAGILTWYYFTSKKVKQRMFEASLAG